MCSLNRLVSLKYNPRMWLHSYFKLKSQKERISVTPLTYNLVTEATLLITSSTFLHSITTTPWQPKHIIYNKTIHTLNYFHKKIQIYLHSWWCIAFNQKSIDLASFAIQFTTSRLRVIHTESGYYWYNVCRSISWKHGREFSEPVKQQTNW